MALLYTEIVVQRFFISLFITIISILKVLTFYFAFGFVMSQGQWIAKSGRKKSEMVKPSLRVTIPQFDNCQGLGSSWTFSYLREIWSKHKPVFLFLSETKQQFDFVQSVQFHFGYSHLHTIHP